MNERLWTTMDKHKRDQNLHIIITSSLVAKGLIVLNINFCTFPNIVCVGGWGGDGSGHLFFFFVVIMKKSTENITIRQYKIMLGVYVSENCTQLSVNWIIICYHWCWKDQISIGTCFPYIFFLDFLRNKGNQKL